MRWRLLLLCGLALIVFGIAALYWAAANGSLTGLVTRWLGAQLGRTLVADGGVRIEVGRVTRISATGLRLANTSWGGRPDMLAARRLVIEVDTRSLLQDTVIVRELMAEGLDLLLERSAAGENNWDFNLVRHNTSTALPVIIERVSIPAAKIRFVGPRLDRPLEVTMDRVEQRLRDDQMLELNIHGQANAMPLDLQASIGPLANLLAASGITVRVEGELGEIALGFGGRIDSLAAPADTEVTLHLQAPDAAYLASHLGIRNLGDGPVALDAMISPAADGGQIRGRVSGRIGEFEVSAQGLLAERAKLGSFAVQAQVAGPDLSLMGGLIGVNRLPVEPFKFRADIQRTTDLVRIQSAELELAAGHIALNGTLGPGGGLAGSHLEFSAKGPDIAKLSNHLGRAAWATGPFEATGTVRGSHQDKNELQVKVTTTLGQLSLAGPIGAAPEFYGTKFAATAAGTDFAPLGRALRIPDPPTGAFQGDGNVEWNRAGIARRGVHLVVAGDALALDGSLGRPRFAERVDLRFTLNGGNAARLAQRFRISGLPPKAYRIEGRIQRQKDRTVLTAVKATVAGAALQLDGTLGDAPGWLATDLAFTVGGPALASFGGVLPDIALPRGAFRAAGQLTNSAKSLQLRQLQIEGAGAHGTVSAEIPLPFGSAAVHFELDARGPDLTLLLPEVRYAAVVGRNFQVSAAGAWLKDQWSVERLKIAGDNGMLSMKGNVTLAPRFSATAVQYEARTPSLRGMGQSAKRDWPDQPLELQGSFSATNTTATLEDLVGRLGKSDFAGRIAARNLNDKPDVDFSIDSKLLDLDPYIVERSPTARATAPPVANGRRGSARLVIPATALHLPALTGLTGSLALRARELHLYEQTFKDMHIQATLRDGRFAVNPLEFNSTDGQINVRADLAAQGKGVTARLTGTGKNLKIQFAPSSVGQPNASVYTADVDLRGSGATLKELAASLNGRIRLLGSGGRIASSRLLTNSNDFLKQLLSTINPIAAKQSTTEIICTALLLKAKDGILTTDPALVMRTAELDVISNGSLDLNTEKLDLNFKTGARTGLGFGMAQLINPYIKVTGTLGNPGVTLDPKGAAVNGGAAFATAGLSILATTAWDRFFRERDPCGAAAAESDRRASH